MKKLQKPLNEMCRLRQKFIALWVLAGLALLGVATVAALSASIQQGPTMATGAVITMLALGLMAIALATLGSKANAKSHNLREQLIALPFYWICGLGALQTLGKDGELEPVDHATYLKLSGIAKPTPLSYPEKTTAYFGNCIMVKLIREGSIQDAFDAFGTRNAEAALNEQIREAISPLLTLIQQADNIFTNESVACLLVAELCRRLGELGPNELGPYRISEVTHQIGRRTLPDDQLKLWEELKAAAAKPTFCQHQMGWLGKCDFCCQQHQADEDENNWRPTACDFGNEAARCQYYLAPKSTI